MTEAFLEGISSLVLDPDREIRNFCLVITFFAFMLNFAMGCYRFGLNQEGTASGWYSGNVSNGLIVRRFFAELERKESELCANSGLDRSPQVIPLQAIKGSGDWSFTVRPRCRSDWMQSSHPRLPRSVHRGSAPPVGPDRPHPFRGSPAGS